MMKFDKKYITGKFPYIVGIIIIVCIAVIYQMVKVMTVDKDEWMEYKKQHVDGRVDVAEPIRGNILSVDGGYLSTSIPKLMIACDLYPNMPVLRKKDKLKNPEKYLKDSLERLDYIAKRREEFQPHIDSISRAVARLCPECENADSVKNNLVRSLQKNSRHCNLFKGHLFDYQEYQKLKEIPIFDKPGKYASGLKLKVVNYREKPFGNLASRTLGDLVRIDVGDMEKAKEEAKAGIELKYDSLLRGKPGLKAKKILRSKSNVVDIMLEPQVDGYDVLTTIDVTMQDICEKALREKLQEVEAEFGVCILMDVPTGDIKAIVNLNRTPEGTYTDNLNNAVGAMMEPGSTFKTASIMVALDDGEITMNDMVDTGGGEVEMYGRKMRDSGGGHGRIDVKSAVKYSSNIGVSRLIDSHYKNDPQRFVNGLRRIGIGSPIGFEIPGTANPLILGPEENKKYWSKVSLPWMAIGYNSQLPPISICTFYNAIANNGRMVRPRVVRGLAKNGEVVEEFPVGVINEHICKDTTVHAIQEILKEVVNGQGGTGKRARSKYFYVSGKTGTAQVADEKGGYHSANPRHYVSFCGYYPSDNPQYTCLVSIKTAHNPVSGGATAGPVFLKIAEQVYSKHVTTNIRLACDTTNSVVPLVKNGNMAAAKNVLSALGLTPRIESDGNSMWGKASVNNNTLVIQGDDENWSQVPDLTGMGARDALYALELRGMKATIRGCGKVVEQSIKPGTDVRRGATVKIKLG